MVIIYYIKWIYWGCISTYPISAKISGDFPAQSLDGNRFIELDFLLIIVRQKDHKYVIIDSSNVQNLSSKIITLFHTTMYKKRKIVISL